MRLLLSKKKCLYFVAVLFLMLISSLILIGLTQNDTKSLKIAIQIQFVLFCILFVLLGQVNRSFITLYSVFLVLFYLFQNGQLLLYSLNVPLDFYYVEKFSALNLFKNVIFSNLCMFSAFAAAVFSFNEKKGVFTKRFDEISPSFIFKTSLLGFIGTGIISYILILIKLIVWIGGRYSAVLVLEAHIPSIIGLVEALFPAFCILSIVSGAKSGKKVRFIVVFFLLWGLITSLIGDRTTGIGVIVIVLLLFYEGFLSTTLKLKKGVFYLGGILTLWLITFAFSFRSHQQFSISSFFDVIVNVIYELGFSFFPLAAIMNMCPATHGFLYGKSMFSSVITGFFPESLDFLGIFSGLADEASIPTHWIADRYQYGFGMDCSLNAEVYSNFGMYGFLAMFIICAFVASALKNVDYRHSQNVFSQYIGFALLFGWFTLPRRRSYYIYNKIFWYVIVIGVFVGLVYLIRKKRGNYAKTK